MKRGENNCVVIDDEFQETMIQLRESIIPDISFVLQIHVHALAIDVGIISEAALNV